MEAQEIVTLFEDFKGNAVAGFAVALYYLIINWQKIKDGLGLGKQEVDLDRIEKNHRILKLRLEIESVKRDSGLDTALLESLEDEMQARQQERKGTPFTSAQKFIAIPLVLFVVLLSLLELDAEGEVAVNSTVDILSGGVFVVAIIVIGFWGMPALQAVRKSWLRKAGFITFWSLGFYILSYMIIFVFVTPEAPQQWLLLFAVILSCVLGMLEILPFMKRDGKDEGAE